MRWAEAMRSVGGVGSVVPHEAWRRRASATWRRWPVAVVYAACTGLATIAACWIAGWSAIGAWKMATRDA